MPRSLLVAGTNCKNLCAMRWVTGALASPGIEDWLILEVELVTPQSALDCASNDIDHEGGRDRLSRAARNSFYE